MSSKKARPTVRALIVCAGVCVASLASTSLVGQNVRPAQGDAPRFDPARELIPKDFEYDLYNLNVTYDFGGSIATGTVRSGFS